MLSKTNRVNSLLKAKKFVKRIAHDIMNGSYYILMPKTKKAMLLGIICGKNPA